MPKKHTGDSFAMPADEEAEAQVIGLLLVQPSLLDASNLSQEDFYSEEYSGIFKAMESRRMIGDAISAASLHSEASIPLERLKQIQKAATDAKDFNRYVRKLKSLSLKRQLIRIGSELCNEAMSPSAADEVFDNTLQKLYSLTLLGSSRRFAIFQAGEISTSDRPIYKFEIAIGEQIKQVSLDSEELDRREKVKMRIREVFHVNPILPDKKNWDRFVNDIISRAVKKEAPRETKQEEDMAFWLREWHKISSLAESVDDLAKGYVARDNSIYFQPHRVRKWISEQTRMNLNMNKFWLMVSARGGVKDKSIKVGEESRKFWGIPSSFFEFEVEEQPDISYLTDLLED